MDIKLTEKNKKENKSILKRDFKKYDRFIPLYTS